MSRQLPSQPNLEHLKKQAKALLQELQQSDPEARLADAQHALARDYGFASWPRLKTHVESISATRRRPLAGHWVADVARSRQHPANLFRGGSIHIDVQGDTVAMTDVFVDEFGTELRGSNEVQADGVERETPGGYAVTVRWRDERTLEIIARRAGVLESRGTYEVSSDGQTLVVTSAQQRIVLERA